MLIDWITKYEGDGLFSSPRSEKLKAALSAYGGDPSPDTEAGVFNVLAEEKKAKNDTEKKKDEEPCDVNEVRELLSALKIIDQEIAAAPVAGGGLGQTGGGVKEFLLDLRNAVLKCLGRCGRKAGAAANSLGDLVIGLFDPESVRRRQAARAALPAVGDDALVQEGAVIAGELAVVGVTVGLGGGFDPLYEPLKALLLPMVYGAVIGIPSFIMALGKRLIAMGVVGCAGGALTLFGLLKLALIRRTARGVVSAAGAAAGVVAGSPDAILDALNVAAKASAYAVFKTLKGPEYSRALTAATERLKAALALPEAAAAEAGAAAAGAAAEAGAGAGALAAGLLPAEAGAGAAAPAADAAAAEGILENAVRRAPAAVAAAIRKVATAGNIAMNAIKNGAVGAAGNALLIARGTQSLVAAGVVGLIKKLVERQSAAIADIDFERVFEELNGASLAENQEVREAVAAADALQQNAAGEGEAARSAVEAAVAAAAAPAAGAAAAAEAAVQARRPLVRPRQDGDESDEDADAGPQRRRTGEPVAEPGAGAAAVLIPAEDEEAMPAAGEGLGGGHRCPKCGSTDTIAERLFGTVKKPKRKTRRAAPKKVKKSKKSKTSKKGGSYRKNRKMSEKRRR